MTPRLIVSREARADIAEAIEWFRALPPDLTERFRDGLETVYSSIVEHPEMYPIVYRRFHRALMRKFPYSVFYTTERDVILIIGAVHQARDESTWKRRA